MRLDSRRSWIVELPVGNTEVEHIQARPAQPTSGCQLVCPCCLLWAILPVVKSRGAQVEFGGGNGRGLAPGPYPLCRTVRIVAKTTWNGCLSPRQTLFPTVMDQGQSCMVWDSKPPMQSVLSYSTSCTDQGPTSQLPQKVHVSPCSGECLENRTSFHMVPRFISSACLEKRSLDNSVFRRLGT